MDLKNVIKTVPDFPVKGIMYKDVTSILENPEAFRYTVTKLTDYCMRNKITDIVAPDARGFLWGSPVAIDMEVPLHIVRKPGKLPRAIESASYSLEYGEDSLEIHKEDLVAGQRVLFVDDLLATGGTANAAIRLIKALNAEVVGCAFVIELEGLNGRMQLKSVPCRSLLKY